MKFVGRRMGIDFTTVWRLHWVAALTFVESTLNGSTTPVTLNQGFTDYGLCLKLLYEENAKEAIEAAKIEQIPANLTEAVHAEVNIRAWVDGLKKTTGESIQVRRWGISAGFSGKYICSACRQIAQQTGGIIEEF